MVVTVEEFEKYAMPEQLAVLERLRELGDREAEAERRYAALVNEYNEQVRRERFLWGLNFQQISDLVIDQEIAPRYDRGIRRAESKFWAARAEVGVLLNEAVEKHGMGDLGIVQRHYKDYVATPLPRAQAA